MLKAPIKNKSNYIPQNYLHSPKIHISHQLHINYLSIPIPSTKIKNISKHYSPHSSKINSNSSLKPSQKMFNFTTINSYKLLKRQKMLILPPTPISLSLQPTPTFIFWHFNPQVQKHSQHLSFPLIQNISDSITITSRHLSTSPHNSTTLDS